MVLTMNVYDKRPTNGQLVFIGSTSFSWDSFDNPNIGKLQTQTLGSRKDRKDKVDSGDISFKVSWVPNSKPRGTLHLTVNEVISAPKGKYCIVRLVSGFDTWRTDYGACVPSVSPYFIYY